ncbi:acetyltransferase [Aliarcobacter lanthieri]|uniref:acetyltransferase n=1 Tax=Aliarcobacter lanthieri TaxID=1355374 RepID=UPI0004794284|nr:acetyltransferase [Aliarcobacter lanthieri]QKF58950.1 sugar O-acyltransferase [Aliarcobacter lanthieri]
MKEKIVLVGGGGHCHSVIDVIELENKYKIIGIVDTKENIGKKVLDYEIIACDDNLEELFKTCQNAVITIGQIKSNSLRVNLFEKLKNIGFNLSTIISPLAYVSKYSKIDEGTVVMHHALINANARIGKNCIINTKALIEHDVIVEDNCHISTASVINGGVIVKENTFFGSNAMSKEYIQIGKNCLIGGGTRVLSNQVNNSVVKNH